MIGAGGIGANGIGPGGIGPGVLLDVGALTRCRRRVHLDHDPSAAGAVRALPDPALEQRRSDASEHRDRIGGLLAAAAGPSWHPVEVPGPAAARAARTAELVAEAAPLIWGAVLPLDRESGRRGSADLLVRVPGGGYVPLLVVRRRITDPGEGARTTAVTDPFPQRARTDPDRKVRSQPRDLLALAQLTRMLENAGWAATGRGAVGGVIGMDADVVVWHDLEAGHWPGGRGTLAEYDARFADRRAVAEAAASGAPALARPSRITECRRCPWWPTCEAELEAADDVSLVAHGETGRLLRTAGVGTVAALAELDPAGPVPAELPVPLPGLPFTDLVALARARRQGRTVVRRTASVPVPRADVEVDVDLESFGEAGAYLWGALLTHPGGRRDGDPEPGYRAFATWEPLPTSDEGRSFAEFWTWLTGVRDAARGSGRTFAAYCYNEQAENRWMVGSAARFAGVPGVPSAAEVQGFIDDPGWVDLFGVVSQWFLCTHGKGLKKIAPAAGFAWRDPEAGGENSMRWYRDAVGMDGGEPDPAQRRRLLDYNADDVAATHVLREWMSSDRVLEVPLVTDL